MERHEHGLLVYDEHGMFARRPAIAASSHDHGDAVAKIFGVPWSPPPAASAAALDNPADAHSVDTAIERVRLIAEGLDDATRTLLYNVLHAQGARVEPNYLAEFRKRWKKKG